MQTTGREDCLLIVALARFSYEFREADPELAARAWSLAIVLAAEHGWTLGEAVRLL